MKKTIKFFLDFSVHLILAALLLGVLFAFATVSPQIRESIVRQIMYDSAVYVEAQRNVGRHIGTGFHITAPNGKKFIITVDHVCARSDNGSVTITSEVYEKVFKTKILAREPENDLCLLPAYHSDKITLPLKTNWYSGENIWVYGYPGIKYGMFAQYGQMLTLGTISIDMSISDKLLCDKIKGVFQNTDHISLFSIEKGKCTRYHSNVVYGSYVSQPGLSGGPAVNIYGQVVGMNIAYLRQYSYGALIPSQVILNFIKKYQEVE